jgi:hypothetical protein
MILAVVFSTPVLIAAIWYLLLVIVSFYKPNKPKKEVSGMYVIYQKTSKSFVLEEDGTVKEFGSWKEASEYAEKEVSEAFTIVNIAGQ